MNDRKLPVGIQSFAEIRREGYLYVDKTDIIWRLANRGKKYNYLSRPRRFGKSILVDTLQAYFEGKKELFEGLKVMKLEKEWTCYPVIRLDMSCGGAAPEELNSYLDDAFYKYEQKYEVAVRPEASLAVRFRTSSKRCFKRPENRRLSSSMSMILHCSIPGRLQSMMPVQPSINPCLLF